MGTPSCDDAMSNATMLAMIIISLRAIDNISIVTKLIFGFRHPADQAQEKFWILCDREITLTRDGV